MKTLKLLVLALVLGIFAAGAVLAADPKPQALCPVLGGNIDKKVYADNQGQRIYFCCQGCDAEFGKNPEKYMKKLQEQGVTPEKSPAAK
jgi:YHS domain-containing protein